MDLIKEIQKIDDSLDRDRHTHSGDYRGGLDDAIDCIVKFLKPYRVYDELIEKVASLSSLWDDLSGDEAELLLSEINRLLNKIKEITVIEND